VQPPRGLFLPVLPQKINGKNVYALCRECASTQDVYDAQCSHSDDARALTGTWSTAELKLALSVGYVITEAYQVGVRAKSTKGHNSIFVGNEQKN